MEYLRIAEEKVPNKQVLVNLISYRTRQLNSGARPMVKKDHAEMYNHDMVLKEIAEGVLSVEIPQHTAEQEDVSLDFDPSILI